jgi:PAS domain S-box-containing protein
MRKARAREIPEMARKRRTAELSRLVGAPGTLPARRRQARAGLRADADREPAGLLSRPSVRASLFVELFTWAPMACVILDLQGVVREVNARAAELLGLSPQRLVGRPLGEFFSGADRGMLFAHLQRVRSGEGRIEDEATLRTAAGRRIPIRIATHRCPRVSDEICWTVLTDLSEHRRLLEARRRAAERQREAEHERLTARSRAEAKDQFLATLSHELRTPLAPALMAASVLDTLASLPHDARTLVETIRRNIEIEVRLIDDLLDVTRIVRQKLQIERTPVEVHELLRESRETWSGAAQARQIQVVLDARAHRSWVNADPVRLRQVFWNLLDNAIKFTPPRGQVTVTTVNDEQGHIRVAVRDTGVGIDPRILPSLFVPFEQAGRQRFNRGLGLGLAICQGIVDAHGGRFRGSSEGLGRGAVFELELTTVEPPAERRPAAAMIERQASAPLRVLVIEDHADSAETLRLLLASAGHRVEVAGSVAAALERAGAGWDIIISDLELPDGTGYEIARRMHALPDRPRLIVALTGYGSTEDMARSHRAGFDSHLVKPVDPAKLVALLESVARERRRSAGRGALPAVAPRRSRGG